MEDDTVIPAHHSAVRHMVNAAHGTPYQPLNSFDQAKHTEDAVVVMEGDWGGQIYLVCPMRVIRCDEATLQAVLRELDAIAWQCIEGARIFYERARLGQIIAGGMGGGVVTDAVWLHETFSTHGIAERIRHMLAADAP